MTVNARRHDTKKIARAEGVEIHVSRLVADINGVETPDYIEIREYSVDGEAYGHGILLPDWVVPEILTALTGVVDDK